MPTSLSLPRISVLPLKNRQFPFHNLAGKNGGRGGNHQKSATMLDLQPPRPLKANEKKKKREPPALTFN